MVRNESDVPFVGSGRHKEVLLMQKQEKEIVWVAGYPRVVGVNMPTPGELTPEIKPKPQEVKLPLKSQPAGGHDLRGGRATQGGSR